MISTILSFLLPAAAVVATKSATAETTKTLDNLQAAFNGESNAHAHYLAFAKKADEEGYGEVASLFRAASKAEGIHAANHARVIREMGAEPEATIEPAHVRSTRENLQVAIDGETYERDQMYRSFVEEATAAKNASVIKTFTFALKTEAEHVRLYSEALKNLEKLRGKSHTYYVCSECGYTVETLNFLKCIVCGHPKDDYIRVS
ncbi:MAG: rubrerythrin family protein [Acidobacteriia bacterium]|nr:rubrerythrin family protein [Terriglobia bacterium]